MEREDCLRAAWDLEAANYERKSRRLEQWFLASSRPWIGARARGRVLDVGIGTGLNIPHYDRDVCLTGVDWSAAMLDAAARRAATAGLTFQPVQARANALPFPDCEFDTVVATYVLCSVSSVEHALREMARVTRPGGLILLADHVASTMLLARGVQALLERFTVPAMNEHFRRRPFETAGAIGLRVIEAERERLGIIERVAIAVDSREPAAPFSGIRST